MTEKTVRIGLLFLCKKRVSGSWNNVYTYDIICIEVIKMYQFGQMSIIHVNGENGARGYQIPPNSSAILLDDTAPLIWVVQTDMAGYKTTVSPYKIEPYEIPKPLDPKVILDRLSKLEEMINESHKPSINHD